MYKGLVFTIIIATVLFFSGAYAWWNYNWHYRIPVNITEPDGSAKTNMWVKINLDTSQLISDGMMNSDCSDIRIVDSDNTTELPVHFLDSECNSANTRIWTRLNISASETKTVYVYTGNLGATSVNLGTGVYDDFEDETIDTSKWNVYSYDGGYGSSSVYETSGYIHVGGVSSNCDVQYAFAESKTLDDLGTWFFKMKVYKNQDQGASTMLSRIYVYVNGGWTKIFEDCRTPVAGACAPSEGYASISYTYNYMIKCDEGNTKLYRLENDAWVYLNQITGCATEIKFYTYDASNIGEDHEYIYYIGTTPLVLDVDIQSMLSTVNGLPETYPEIVSQSGSSVIYSNDTLVGQSTYAGPNAETNSKFEWWVNGVKVKEGTGVGSYTLSNSEYDFVAGDSITFVCTPCDDTGYCGSTQSTTKIVENWLPIISESMDKVKLKGGSTETWNFTILDADWDSGQQITMECSLDGGQNQTYQELVLQGGNNLTYSAVIPEDDGTHSVNCSFSDGYNTTTYSDEFQADSTPPSTGVIGIENNGGYTNDPTPTLTLFSDGAYYMRFACIEDMLNSAVWHDYFTTFDSFDMTAGPGCTQDEGLKTVYVEFMDDVENIQTTHTSANVIYDATPPIPYLSITGSYELPGFTLTFSESDNFVSSTDITTYYCVDQQGTCQPTTLIDDGGTITLDQRGTNYILTNSTDKAGNQNITQFIQKINMLPNVTNVTISPQEVYSNTDLSCNVDNIENEPDQPITLYYTWYVNGVNVSTDQTLDASLGLFAKDDQVYCEAWAYDGMEYGPSNTSEVKTVLGYKPTMDAISATPYVKQDDTITVSTVNAHDEDGGNLVLKCTETPGDYSIVLCQTAPGQPERSCSFTSFWTDDEAHQIYCVIVDSDGYVSDEKSATIISDNTPPTTTSDYAYNNTWHNEAASITLNATDLSGVNETKYCFGESCTPDLVYCSGESCDSGEGVSPIQIGEGITYLRFNSIDVLGNVEPIQTLIVKIDTTSPTIEVTYPQSIAMPSQNFSAVFYDNLDESPSALYCVDNDGVCVPDTTLTNNTNITLPSLRGLVHIRINATDHANNYNLKDVEFRVNTLPVITDISIPTLTTDTDAVCDAFTNTSKLTPDEQYDYQNQNHTTYYKWYVNGTLLENETEKTLNHTYFSRGDTVKCSAMQNDGMENSSWYDSQEITVVNAPPTVDSISVSSTAPDVDISCTFTASDPDGDTITQNETKWYKNGNETNYTDYMPENETEPGDNFTCSVRVFDGFNWSEWSNYTFTITGICGNGILEPGEECDGSNFGGKTCSSYGYSGGSLTCTSSCTISIDGCSSGGDDGSSSGGGGGGGGGAVDLEDVEFKSDEGETITFPIVFTSGPVTIERDFDYESTFITIDYTEVKTYIREVVKTDKDLRDVRYTTTIPKEFAQKASDITIDGADYNIVKDDPVFELILGDMKAGEEKTVTFTVNKEHSMYDMADIVAGMNDPVVSYKVPEQKAVEQPKKESIKEEQPEETDIRNVTESKPPEPKREKASLLTGFVTFVQAELKSIIVIFIMLTMTILMVRRKQRV
ncbi:MAG: DUF2341 domain-containing protein [Candidatus Diapherotrites archaeon]|nr:DUF2341 domain-containing protein [Candidatus Diapherotrites archaeon]